MRVIKKLAVIVAAFFMGLFIFSVDTKAYTLPPGVEVLSTTAVNPGGGYDVLSFNTLEGGSGITGLPLYGIWQYFHDYHDDEDYVLFPVSQLANYFELYVGDVLVSMDNYVYSILFSYNNDKSSSVFVFRDIQGAVLQAVYADVISSTWEFRRIVIGEDDKSFLEYLAESYQSGKDAGFGEGYDAAGFDYDEAFRAGQLAAEDTNIWGSIQNVFFGVFGLLAIEIVPGVTLGLLMFFPLILGLLFTVVSFARGFRR